MSDLILTTKVTFKAPIQSVWKGLTDPAIVKQYFFGTDLKTDLKKGGRIVFSGEWDGVSYEDGGIILEIDEPNLLKYTYWSSMSGKEDKPENYANVTYELEEKNGVTTLTIIQDNVTDQQALEHSENNWQSIFDGLKKIIETKE